MSEKKAPNRFDSTPPELLDKIYGYLFGLEEAKAIKKVYSRRPLSPSDQLTYVFPTALLRVNHMISQGAQRVLYNNNLFVLIRLTNTKDDIESVVLNKSRHFPIGFVPDKRSLPPCPVLVHHRRHEGKKLDRPGSFAIVIRAFDFADLCKILDRAHYPLERESFSLMALPKAGWPREQLRSLIWEPLRTLRESIVRGCPHCEGARVYYKIKVVDATGTFEPTNKLLLWEPESQHEDCNSEDSEAYSNDGGGYRTELECDQERFTSRGRRLDYETEDYDWSSEDPDSKAESDIEVHSYTSETETLEMGALGGDEETYRGDDELGDDRS